jgi:polysaccharide biosynthesis/export protein
MNESLKSGCGKKNARGLPFAETMPRIDWTGRCAKYFATKRRCSFHGGLAGIVGMLSVLAVLIFSGCQESGKETVTAMVPAKTTAQTPVTLTAGNIVKLLFVGMPELNQSQTIRADGKLSLPLIGEVHASGKKILDFQNELIRLYKPQLANNAVVVTLEAGAIPVYVSGAVNKPGKIVSDHPMTLLEAIMEAGGFSRMGSPKNVHLIRTENGRHTTQIIDLSPALKGKTTDAFYLKGNDVIYVQESVF